MKRNAAHGLAILLLAAPCLGMQSPPQRPPSAATRTAPMAPPPASGGQPALRVPDAIAQPSTALPEPEAGEAPQAESTRRSAFDAAAYRAAVSRAEAALRSEDWATAITQLQEALRLKPDSKEARYNLGVARYRQGQFADARKDFRESAQNSSADLAARSMYNEGRTVYQEVLRNLPKQDPDAAPGASAGPAQAPGMTPQDVQRAVQQVQQAFTHFKDASAADPTDEDSAANAETSLKLLQELKKIEQQQQQQQQQQDQQKQDEQKQDEQKKDQQQNKQDQSSSSQSQQSEDQQQQQQNQGSQGEQQSASKDSSPSSAQSQQDQPQQERRDQQGEEPNQPQPEKEPSKQNQKQDASQQQQPDDSKQQPSPSQVQQTPPDDKHSAPNPQATPSEAQGGKMEKAQADQLLQMVRDKEKQRNAQKKEQAARTRSAPVDRDW